MQDTQNPSAQDKDAVLPASPAPDKIDSPVVTPVAAPQTVQAVEATNLVDTAKPTGPVDPTNLTEATNSVDTVKPVDAIKPVDAVKPTDAVKPMANDPVSTYKQAVDLCNKAIDADVIPEALMWARQAELIKSVIAKDEDTPELTAAYARLMLIATRRSQESALISGNIHHEHKQMADLIATLCDRLVEKSSAAKAETRILTLMAQGFSQKQQLFLKGSMAKHEYGAEKSARTEQLLEILAQIETCAVQLSDASRSAKPVQRNLTLARTVIANARSTISRFAFFSDWDMAEFYCRHAYWLVAKRPEFEVKALADKDNEKLAETLKLMAAAHRAIVSCNYKQSEAQLKTVLDALDACLVAAKP